MSFKKAFKLARTNKTLNLYFYIQVIACVVAIIVPFIPALKGPLFMGIMLVCAFAAMQTGNIFWGTVANLRMNGEDKEE